MASDSERELSLSSRLHTLMCKLHGVAEWLRNANSETLPLNGDEVASGQGEILQEMAEEARDLRDQVGRIEDV